MIEDFTEEDMPDYVDDEKISDSYSQTDSQLSEEEKKFERELDSKFSSNMKRMAGYKNFINYIATLPEAERERIKDVINDYRVAGNSTKEALLVLNHALPFAVGEYFELMTYAGEKIAEDVVQQLQVALGSSEFFLQALKEQSDLVLARTDGFAESLTLASETALQEIESQGKDNLAKFAIAKQNLESVKLQNLKDIEVAKLEALKALEKAVAEIEAEKKGEANTERLKARNIVLKEFSGAIEKETVKAFKKVQARMNIQIFAFNVGSVVVGMTIFTLFSKLFH